MMEVLQPISFEIFVGITHMFQYYVRDLYSFYSKPFVLVQMYTVYEFFGNPGVEDQFSGTVR